MRSYPILAVTAATAACSAVLAGCSSGSDGGNPPPESSVPTGSSTPSTTTSNQTHTTAPGAVGVSPNGVTTAVGAPAESTEDEYFQACHAAKVWMTEQGGDQKAQFEPYLASVQSSDAPGPGTFNKPWSQLVPNRQAAVIVAAEAAADDLCG
ncbi:MAG TPA: lipoprotein LpqV [Mycobacterium sp.]|nr:lipoprotein LpqV [Mycobacterium sp.]